MNKVKIKRDRRYREMYRRTSIFTMVILVVLSILTWRLVYLQLLNNDEFDQRARSNAIKERRTLPYRGAMIDTDGEKIVANKSAFDVTITPRYFNTNQVPVLSDILGVSDSLIYDKLQSMKQYNPYQDQYLLRGVEFDRIGLLAENLYRLSGVNYSAGHQRNYMVDVRMPHVLGYIREIDDDELDILRRDGYRMGEPIGKTGLEKTYEEYLRGIPGARYVIVNTHGAEIGSYHEGREDTNPISGFDIHLTIDADLQSFAESLFVNKRGGMVALNPQTGAIHAMVSSPDYDPSAFTNEVSDEYWEWLMSSNEKPMLNRATMNLLPPGSTWKPFMATLALEEGEIGEHETYTCRGYHPVGGPSVFKDLGVHGSIDVRRALQRSCNSFFFEMMYRTNVEVFQRYAHMFGFGQRIEDFELEEQTSGLIPDSSYFDNLVGEGRWSIGYTMSMGIGQGNMGVTPLQLARYVAAIGSGGKLVKPYFVERLHNPETDSVIIPNKSPSETIHQIDPHTFQVVREGMRLVAEAGTAASLQFGTSFGAKTGTAQNSRGKDDSVFIMFAPWDNPTIAIGVQVENAGYGATAAGPIANAVADRYLNGRTTSPNLVQRALNARSDPLPN